MISLELTKEDAVFLSDQLTSRTRAVENELVHTDKVPLQHDIARDLDRLEKLCERVRRAIAMAENAVAV